MVQKFVPWSRVGIFHNKPLDPPYRTLTSCFGAFCTIWEHLGQFGCVTTLSAKRAKLVQKFVPRNRVRIFRNERTRSTPLDSKLIFWCVLYYLVHLGLFGCLTKHSAKRAELVQKFVPWSRFGIFRNKHTRLTPLGPKLVFWCVSFYLGAFGTVWLPYKIQCKTCRTSTKGRATMSRQNF